MASAAPAPQTDPLTRWRERLRGVSLPAVSDPVAWKSLREGVEDPDQAQQLAEVDLPFALSLLVEACRSPRMAANLTGLQHVLRMLGSDALKARLQRWSAGWIDPAQPAHRLALQAMATSRLACLFHARWMRHGRVADAEHRTWITALLGVARWKLPLIAPDLALQVERRVSAGERRRTVERLLLGCDVEALNALHLKDLGFADTDVVAARARLDPRLLAVAARRSRADDIPEPLPPELARALREPLLSCGLAYALALETQVSWHSPRCQQLLKAAATCLNRSEAGVLNDLHRAAIEASEERQFLRGLLAPAARLIRIPQPRGRRAAAAATPAATAAEPMAEAPSPVSQPRVSVTQALPAADDAFLDRCRRGAFGSLAEFLRASAGFLAGAGLPRRALFLRMRQPERVAVYYSEGFADRAAIQQVSFPSVAGTLLERLLADPRGAYLIAPAQVTAARSKLPAALSGWPLAGGFAVATVQANERALGFWWADAGEAATGVAVDARHFLALRQMANLFGAEFTRLIKLQRAAVKGA